MLSVLLFRSMWGWLLGTKDDYNINIRIMKCIVAISQIIVIREIYDAY